MRTRRPIILVTVFAFTLLAISVAMSWVPLVVTNDPLIRMPGTQPGQVTIEAPSRCMNCHADYNTQVEPGFNWKGSMMAQAGRDFMMWACLAVSAQDSIYALGNPNAVDLCERCHFPKGWLEGRSDPPNGSAMTGADYDGVSCDFCHTQYDPFYETANAGTREGNDWLNYWDETNASKTKSQAAAATAYQEDSTQSLSIKKFNGTGFFVNKKPFSPTYTEAAGGQYFVSSGSQKRASFADANAKHQILYSRFHKSKYACATCHDVSNPALANLPQAGTPPNNGSTILTSEKDSAFSYFHVERTFSEFMLSAYGAQGGAPGVGPFAPGVFKTSLPGNSIARCQDCHMRDVEGVGCDKAGAIFRASGSTEHPMSGQPLHDLTGGNIWVSYILASTVTGSPNYSAVNSALLRQGPAVLTLDLNQGEGINPVALLAGTERARQQLLLAAAIENLAYDPATGQVTFRVRNQTGHKLISGFPEGRRMFLNIKAYSGGNVIYQVNPYDQAIGTLKGLPSSYSPNSPALAAGETYKDELVYEMHPTSSITGETKTFHFVLATGRYKDNRIPPKGFRIGDAAERLCQPVWNGVDDLNYFTAAEYAGGYDEVTLSIPSGADAIEVGLYYQVTSREYIEFLRDEINGNARRTLPDSAYVAQTDPFFTKLKAWGNTIWQIWQQNKDIPGAAPFRMAHATINIDSPCLPPVPVLLAAQPSDQQIVLTWSNVHSDDPRVIGYRIYLDQGGKSQFVDEVGRVSAYTDTGLTTGQLYCYKITSIYADCESDYSNVMCATPAPTYSLAAIKTLPDESWVLIDDAIVTAASDLGWGVIFASSISKVAGVKLLTSDHMILGQRASFTGLVSRVDGEWQVSQLRLLSASPGSPLDPLGMINRAIGNDPSGTLNYVGVNTAGSLVRTWGRVTETFEESRVIYIDDGSKLQDALNVAAGLRVQLPVGVDIPSKGSRVAVTGISRVEKHILPPSSSAYIPAVWVRDASGITAL